MSTQTIGSFADKIGAKVSGETDAADASKAAADQAAADKAASDSAASAKAAADSKSAADAKAASEAADKAKGEKSASTSNPNLSAETVASKEAVAEDEDKKPEGVTEKAWISWKGKEAARKQAIKERDEAKQEAVSIRAELAESGKTKAERDALKKELDETKAKIGEYEQEISITRVEATAKFKEQVTAPQTKIKAAVDEIAKRYDIPAKTLMDAIQEPDAAKRSEALSDAIEDLKLADQLKVGQAEERWQETLDRAASFKTDAGKQLEEIERQKSAEDSQRSDSVKKDYVSSFRTAWENALQATPYVKKVDGAEAWNKHLDAIGEEGAMIDPNDLPVEELAKYKASDLMLPKLLESLTFKDSELKRVTAELAIEKKRLADYKANAMGAGAGNNGNENGSGDGKKDQSFAGSVNFRR